MTAREQQKPWDIVRHCRHLGAKNFDGSLDVNKAVEWLKKIEKVFAYMKMSDKEKVSTTKMFL